MRYMLAVDRAMTLPNRVPRVDAAFWLIKLLAVTVGETAADYLAINLGYGLSMTTWFMTITLLVALVIQFAQNRDVPCSYWVSVFLISVVCTLITDNMLDNWDIALQTSTLFFSAVLALVSAVWYLIERTLSIHTIYTTRREVFYWLAILFTFSLGTAAGDLVSEHFGLGYLVTGVIFGAIVVAIAIAYFMFQLDGILAFWLAYIFTRPVGASFGDLLSQPTEYGGLGLGTIVTSWVFLGAIAATILYMTLTYRGKQAVASGSMSIGE